MGEHLCRESKLSSISSEHPASGTWWGAGGGSLLDREVGSPFLTASLPLLSPGLLCSFLLDPHPAPLFMLEVAL